LPVTLEAYFCAGKNECGNGSGSGVLFYNPPVQDGDQKIATKKRIAVLKEPAAASYLPQGTVWRLGGSGNNRGLDVPVARESDLPPQVAHWSRTQTRCQWSLLSVWRLSGRVSNFWTRPDVESNRR
jgi:hypothetical protein